MLKIRVGDGEEQAKDLLRLFKKGNSRAIAEVCARVDGPMPTTVDHTNNGDKFTIHFPPASNG